MILSGSSGKDTTKPETKRQLWAKKNSQTHTHTHWCENVDKAKNAKQIQSKYAFCSRKTAEKNERENIWNCVYNK